MSRLFDRVYRLVIVRVPPSDTFSGSNPGFFEQENDAIEITQMAVKFQIKKNLAKNPNPCTIYIYNLAASTRHLLEHDVCQIFLYAGYDGIEKLLFAGDRRFGTSKQSRTEWETKVEVADGGRAYQFARTSRSYKAGTQVLSVVKDCAADMGLTLPQSVLSLPALKQAVPTGQSLQGATRDILTRVLSPLDYGWSSQNGNMQLLRDQDVRPGTAFLVNQKTGLLGSPERVSPDHKNSQNKISFETQLYPELIPGAAVKLESEEINGTFKIKELEHEGETHGSNWKTKVKAEPITG